MQEDLINRREAIKEAFDNQEKIRQAALEEQLRLQGEYRAVNALIEETENKKEKKK